MVYLDYNASTPLDPRVCAAMAPVVERHFGNASSIQHVSGQEAAEFVEQARHRVADLLARPSRDVVFASGASEAATIGILGAVLGGEPGRRNIVVGATEHKAVLSAADLAARLSGGEVRVAPVDSSGRVMSDLLANLVDESVALVAIMAANNETGVLAPLASSCEVARTYGALFFSDVTQLAGKGDVRSVSELADLCVLSSHKIYGPKGAGALIASRHVQRGLLPLLAGGGQEFGLRGGTHNTPAIVGFGVAAELAMKETDSDTSRLGGLSEDLLVAIKSDLTDVELNGDGVERLPNTLNVRFVGADAEAVMASMPDIEVSSGSACQSATPTPSHVLMAMGLDGRAAAESLRLSLGRPTTDGEIEYAVSCIVAAVRRVREMSLYGGVEL